MQQLKLAKSMQQSSENKVGTKWRRKSGNRSRDETKKNKIVKNKKKIKRKKQEPEPEQDGEKFEIDVVQQAD